MFGGFFNKIRGQNGKFKRPYYSICNVHSGKVLDIAQDGPYRGTGIIWEGWGGDNQCFAILQQQDGLYCFKNKNNQYLTVESGQDGARLFLSPLSPNAPNQKFKIVTKSDKEHLIITCFGKAIDVL